MIFGQNFYNIESMTAKELDEMLIVLKKILDSGKFTTYLPNNTISELNIIKQLVKDLDDNISKELANYVTVEAVIRALENIMKNFEIIDGGEYNS